MRAADRGAVAADIFGGRIDDDGRAMLERPAEDGRRRVVHDQRHAELAADIGDFLDREDAQLRIGQGLGVIGAGLVIGGLGEGLRILRIDEAHLDALVLQRVGEQIPGAAVKVGGGDDVVAGLGDVLDRKGRRPPGRMQRRGPRRRLRAPRGAVRAPPSSGS